MLFLNWYKLTVVAVICWPILFFSAVIIPDNGPIFLVWGISMIFVWFGLPVFISFDILSVSKSDKYSDWPNNKLVYVFLPVVTILAFVPLLGIISGGLYLWYRHYIKSQFQNKKNKDRNDTLESIFSNKEDISDKNLLKNAVDNLDIEKILEESEKIKYMIKSGRGYKIQRIISNTTVTKSVGSRSHIIITNKKVILIGHLKHYDIFNYSCIPLKDIFNLDYKKSIVNSRITIETRNEHEIKVSSSNPSNSGGILVAGFSPIKFQFRRFRSGVKAKEVVSYIKTRSYECSSEFANELYEDLIEKAEQQELEGFDIPIPDSFSNYNEARNEYNEINTVIDVWLDLVQKCKDDKTLSENISINSPNKFDNYRKAHKKYVTLSKSIEEWSDIVQKYKKENSKMSNFVLSAVPLPDEFENAEQASEKYDEIDKVGNKIILILEIVNKFECEYPNLPFSAFKNSIHQSIKSQGLPKEEQIDTWYQIVTESRKILTFLSNVDTSHSSINEKEWIEQIELAITEEYPNVLHPIHKKVERMDGSLWEHSDFDSYSWQEFENLVGDLYQSLGYNAKVTSDTADMGVDVWASKNGEQIAIQAKKYQKGNSVGRETLQKLASTLAKGDANHAIVVTTSSFARTAEDYAKEFGPDLEIIDGDELIDMLNNSKLPPPV